MNAVAIRIILVVLFACLISPTAPTHAQDPDPGPIYQEDFEAGQAQGWDLEPGWKVIQDEGSQVLAGQGHQWARSNVAYDDYRLTFRLKAVQGTIHLVYRYNNTGRYFIGFQEDGAYLHKQLWPDTFFHELAASRKPYHLDTWHEVQISSQAGTLELVVDGETAWTYTDPEPILDGSFAFETLDESRVYIDDIAVTLAPTSAYIPVPGTIPASSLAWVRTGGPLGGLGYDVRMQPDNPDHMFVTDANAGVFVSDDGGHSWTLSNEGIVTRSGATGDIIPIFCLTIDPRNPDIVWAGTQDARGVFKSQDGGRTWEEKINGIAESQGITFRGFSVDPGNSDIVYAAAEIASYVWNNGIPVDGREFDMTRGVIYKTTDGGQSWTAIWRGDNLARYVWIDPHDTDVLYASTGIFDREAANSDPVAGYPGGEGVLKSTDGGQTWKKVNDGLGNLYVGSLFMHPADPEILLAATGNIQYHEHAGVYRTVDGGAHWDQVLSREVIEAVEVASSHPSVAYAAGFESFYRSDDAGATWTRVAGGVGQNWGPAGVRIGFPIDLQVDPRNPDRIFANAYGGGNFLSEDGGKTWEDASRGYTGAQVRAIAVDPNHPARLVAAARTGLFASRDGGMTWDGLCYPPAAFMEWNAVAIDPVDPQHLVAGTNSNGALLLSRDGGFHWDVALELPGQRIGWKALALAPSDSSMVYAGSAGYFSAGSFDPNTPGNGIYASHDGGETWTPANDSLSQDAHVSALAVHPHDPRVVYAATANHGLLKSADGGQHWQPVQSGLPGDSTSTVAINPADPDVIFAGFDRKSLYVSRDGGETWEPTVRGMMPEAVYTSIVFDPADPLATVYAADGSSGVYRSVDGGENWSLINTGLTIRAINALAISTDGLHLVAATEGGGVFRLDVSGDPPAPAPEPAPHLQAGPTPTAIPSPAEPTSSTAAPPPASADSSRASPCSAAAALPVIVLGLSFYQRRRNR